MRAGCLQNVGSLALIITTDLPYMTEAHVLDGCSRHTSEALMRIKQELSS